MTLQSKHPGNANLEHKKQQGSFTRQLIKFSRVTDRPLEYIVLGLSAIVAILLTIFVEGFANWGNLEVLAHNSAALTILSCGMGVVIITRGLDLSQIAIMVATATVFGILLNAGQPYGVALTAAFIAAIVMGILNGVLIAFIEIPALLTTLATAMLITGISRWGLLQGQYMVMLPKEAPIITYISTGRLFSFPVTVVFGIIVLSLTYLLLNKTVIGRNFYALGENFNTARLTGLSVRVGIVAAYIFAACTAMIAGIIVGSSSGTVDYRIVTNGTFLFEVVMVAVLGGISLRGGRGGIFSIIAGVLLVSILRNGITLMNLSSQVQNMIMGLVLILAIVIDTFFNPRDAETDIQGDL